MLKVLGTVIFTLIVVTVVLPVKAEDSTEAVVSSVFNVSTIALGTARTVPGSLAASSKLTTMSLHVQPVPFKLATTTAASTKLRAVYYGLRLSPPFPEASAAGIVSARLQSIAYVLESIGATEIIPKPVITVYAYEEAFGFNVTGSNYVGAGHTYTVRVSVRGGFQHVNVTATLPYLGSTCKTINMVTVCYPSSSAYKVSTGKNELVVELHMKTPWNINGSGSVTVVVETDVANETWTWSFIVLNTTAVSQVSIKGTVTTGSRVRVEVHVAYVYGGKPAIPAANETVTLRILRKYNLQTSDIVYQAITDANGIAVFNVTLPEEPGSYTLVADPAHGPAYSYPLQVAPSAATTAATTTVPSQYIPLGGRAYTLTSFIIALTVAVLTLLAYNIYRERRGG